MHTNLRTVNVTRYITPLREGGSLPALAEADDDFNYVLKFRGAGHGVKALIAEFLGGQIARFLGLPVPELVFATLDEAFGRTEGDEEIQDLLQGSQGLNLGLHFLSGALTYDAAVNDCDALLASKIVWLDAYITNVDRTFKNTNLLIWKKELWLIDHGAAFYFHHSWDNWKTTALTPFALIKDHVLLPKATRLEEVNAEFTSKLNDTVLREIVNQIPEDWLLWEDQAITPTEIKEVYFQFLSIRLANASIFLKQAQDVRTTLI
ncbi:MAG TPA: aminotransferase class I and II [Flavobacterium sp.]|uniref:HipA family kinase n=1 Tax=unclassified Flavobacterium TaxID=196869 RepID=UPI000E9749F3|nr:MULTISPECIES: HipA family kinase [unclassified Flavobacterium]HBI01271.1 aminotransferase class I and II [Flavobacterium sp.]HRE76657.1 aminotransferase class I and II [Flavobacterium sp.]